MADGTGREEVCLRKRKEIWLLAGLMVIGTFLLQGCEKSGGGADGPGAEKRLEESLAVSKQVRELKSTDGQPLIAWSEKKEVPPRPQDPDALPKMAKGHWWDMEFAGWKTEKVNIPESPGDGAVGKEVVLLRAGDHPYWTAYQQGFKRVAEAYDIDLTVYNSNWNIDLQAQQTEQAINQRPDMIIFCPVDATACTPLVREINRAGVPVMGSNTLLCDRAMKYVITWTGPDDWGQFRMLARKFADAMGKQGSYAVVRHMPGSSCFFARTYGAITEIKEYAPQMEMLTMDTSQMEAQPTLELVSAWLTKYGEKLDGIVLPGDGFVLTGALQAARQAGRQDIKMVGAGSSKTGLEAVRDGEVLGITYQTAEGDGGLACFTAAQWFEGKDLPPVRYLPKHVITKKDVDDYLPAQW